MPTRRPSFPIKEKGKFYSPSGRRIWYNELNDVISTYVLAGLFIAAGSVARLFGLIFDEKKK